MAYSVDGYGFDLERFFPKALFDEITNIRVSDPDLPLRHAQARKRREVLAPDGKLTVLATDHPARGITKSGDDPLAMGNRWQYLGRVLRVAMSEEFDGIMGPTDILEDLFILDYLHVARGGSSFLDGKVLLGCMNRGGLAGAVFEMDDRMTSWTAESIRRYNLDGSKTMVRIDLDNPDSGKTLKYIADAVTEMNAFGLYSFVEVLAVERGEGGYKVLKEKGAQIRVNGVASALGDSSRYMWLKIPYCDGFEEVALSTTLPILMLGGASKNDPTPMIEEFVKGMRAGANVRGTLVGRNVLFPGPDDPAAVAAAVYRIVHDGYGVEEALEYIVKSRDRRIDAWTCLG